MSAPAPARIPLGGTLLRCVSLKHLVYTPNGNGTTADYLRVPSYEIALDGDFVRVRSGNVSNGVTVEIPLSNVACFERLVTEPKPELKASPAPATKVA